MSDDKEFGALELTDEEANNLDRLLIGAAGRLDAHSGRQDHGDVLMDVIRYLDDRRYSR